MKGLTVAVQMDALTAVNFATDSTVALMAGALRRGHKLYVYEPQDLSFQPGLLSAPARRLFDLHPPLPPGGISAPERLDLGSVDVILLRQDPPYHLGYLASTHLLELAGDHVRVLNDPEAVRNAPEKMLVLRFPDFLPPTLITRDRREIGAFRETHRDLVIKPLFGHAGHGVFHLREDDENYASALEQLLARGPEPIIVQRYLPEVRESGDRRIILFEGEPVGIFARVPAKGEARAAMRTGSAVLATTLTAREREICAALGPTLRELGLFFVGIDVIGGCLTEINVTSPTGIVQCNTLYGTRLEDDFWARVETTA